MSQIIHRDREPVGVETVTTFPDEVAPASPVRPGRGRNR